MSYGIPLRNESKYPADRHATSIYWFRFALVGLWLVFALFLCLSPAAWAADVDFSQNHSELKSELKSVLVAGLENPINSDAGVGRYLAESPALSENRVAKAISGGSISEFNPSIMVAAYVILMLIVSGLWMISLLRMRILLSQTTSTEPL